jgi:uncharacterized protein (TIGR03067 family)
MKATTILVCSISLVIFGCSTLPESDLVVLKGKWSGEEVGRTAAGTASLLVEESTLEFHGADTNEWYKGTFTLREDTNPKQVVAMITDCPAPQYVGKAANAIYKIEAGTLTLTGNEPGNPEVPPSFDAPGSRRFVLKKP